jgi:hypothetical protein
MISRSATDGFSFKNNCQRRTSATVRLVVFAMKQLTTDAALGKSTSYGASIALLAKHNGQCDDMHVKLSAYRISNRQTVLSPMRHRETTLESAPANRQRHERTNE